MKPPQFILNSQGVITHKIVPQPNGMYRAFPANAKGEVTSTEPNKSPTLDLDNLMRQVKIMGSKTDLDVPEKDPNYPSVKQPITNTNPPVPNTNSTATTGTNPDVVDESIINTKPIKGYNVKKELVSRTGQPIVNGILGEYKDFNPKYNVSNINNESFKDLVSLPQVNNNMTGNDNIIQPNQITPSNDIVTQQDIINKNIGNPVYEAKKPALAPLVVNTNPYPDTDKEKEADKDIVYDPKDTNKDGVVNELDVDVKDVIDVETENGIVEVNSPYHGNVTNAVFDADNARSSASTWKDNGNVVTNTYREKDNNADHVINYFRVTDEMIANSKLGKLANRVINGKKEGQTRQPSSRQLEKEAMNNYIKELAAKKIANPDQTMIDHLEDSPRVARKYEREVNKLLRQDGKNDGKNESSSINNNRVARINERVDRKFWKPTGKVAENSQDKIYSASNTIGNINNQRNDAAIANDKAFDNSLNDVINASGIDLNPNVKMANEALEKGKRQIGGYIPKAQSGTTIGDGYKFSNTNDPGKMISTDEIYKSLAANRGLEKDIQLGIAEKRGTLTPLTNTVTTDPNTTTVITDPKPEPKPFSFGQQNDLGKLNNINDIGRNIGERNVSFYDPKSGSTGTGFANDDTDAWDPTRLHLYGNKVQHAGNMVPVMYNSAKYLFDKAEVQNPIYNKQDVAFLQGARRNMMHTNMNPIADSRAVLDQSIRGNARGSGQLMNALQMSANNAAKAMNEETYKTKLANQNQMNNYLQSLNAVGNNRREIDTLVDEKNRQHRLTHDKFGKDTNESYEKALINKGLFHNKELEDHIKLKSYLNNIGTNFEYVTGKNGVPYVKFKNKKTGQQSMLPMQMFQSQMNTMGMTEDEKADYMKSEAARQNTGAKSYTTDGGTAKETNKKGGYVSRRNSL